MKPKNIIILFLILLTYGLSYSQTNTETPLLLSENQIQKNNWTKADEVNFKADCKRGLKDSKSSLTTKQQDDYCDCIFNKIKTNFPNKYSSQPPLEWMKTNAKNCLKTILHK